MGKNKQKPPYVTTTFDLEKTMVKRFDETYRHYWVEESMENFEARTGWNPKKISVGLHKLEKEGRLTRKNVAQLVRTPKFLDGMRAWFLSFCSTCNEYSDWVITVGAEPDYESATASLCRKCWKEAVKVAAKK